MTKAFRRVAACVLAIATLVGSQHLQARERAVSLGPSIRLFSTQLTQLPDCDETKRVAGVVRIHLKHVLSESGTVRNVRYKRNILGDDDDKDWIGYANGAPVGVPAEPFDVYVPTMDQISLPEGELLEIRVVIRNKNRFEFASLTDGTQTFDAIAAGVGNQHLCAWPNEDIVNLTGSGRQYARFFVVIAPKAGGGPLEHVFNILLKIAGSNHTPIIIDPKVRNNG